MALKIRRYNMVSLFVILSLVCIVASEDISDDPLLPIWEYLDRSADNIVRSVRLNIDALLRATHDNIDYQFQHFVSSVKNVTSEEGRILNDLEARVVNLHKVHVGVMMSVGAYHEQTIKPDLESVIPFSNERISKALTAMENRTSQALDAHALTVAPKAQTHGETLLSDLSNNIIGRLDDFTDKLSSLNAGLNSTHKTIQVMNGTYAKRQQDDNDAICAELANQTKRLIRDGAVFEESVDYLTRQYQQDPVHLPRDCSDYHWHHPDATSGVYTVYPTRDPQVTLQVKCDMDELGDGSDGGWTVILRRRNTSFGLINFNRSWEEYADGFGTPGQGEWWLGLTWQHALTFTQPYQVRFLLRDMEEGMFMAEYKTFRVEDEARKFRLVVEGFSGNVSGDAFKTKHANLPFSTPDQDNDNCQTCNCAFNNQGGWWYNVCHWTALTAPFPTEHDENQRVIKWLSGFWLVLDDVSMKIRPTR